MKNVIRNAYMAHQPAGVMTERSFPMLVLKRMSVNDKEGIKELFADVFTKEPWNDDWSDKDQLDLYITDLTGQSISLTYGLYDGDELIGISMGYIKHWYSGTEYFINEYCIRTDRQGSGAGTFFLSGIEKDVKRSGIKQIFLLTETDSPACAFYKKNGFSGIPEITAFTKELPDV